MQSDEIGIVIVLKGNSITHAMSFETVKVLLEIVRFSNSNFVIVMVVVRICQQRLVAIVRMEIFQLNFPH